MTNKDHDDIDGILDSALSSYSADRRSSGLEERVLTRVRYQAGDLRPRWLAPSLSALAIGCLACALVFFSTAKKPALQIVEHIPSVPQPIHEAQIAAHTPFRRTPKLRRARKLSQFPAPSPLTREERALLVLAKLTPDELTKLSSYNEEIRIESLQVQPLDDEH